ncbi:MAG: ATP-binding protein [Candidatus Woesearchaeota archaeon]
MAIIEQIEEKLNKDFLSNIIGLEEEKELIKSALLSEHHILFVGPPGTGKTTIAKSIANLLPTIEMYEVGGFIFEKDSELYELFKDKAKKTIKKGIDRFVRIQGSPDLIVEDLLGDIDPEKALKYGAFSLESFKPGKIFKANKGILFFDEINRAPEKVQNALLQVLAEKRITLSGYEIEFPLEFILIGTMNPDDSSTENLSDVMLDRFDVIYIDYPKTIENEIKIVQLNGKNFGINVSKEMMNLIVGFVRSLRTEEFEKKPSIRASINLFSRSCATAKIKNRNYLLIEDIEENIISTLSHRVRLKPSYRYSKKIEDYIIQKWHSYIKKGSDFL